jgi:NAD(P)-dependent dehydrogenase (short-subunit alcohol dehydrogenase family)
MDRLNGKTALITGGTTGIGLATAKLFIAEGARVAIIGQDAQRVREAKLQLPDSVLCLRANVASPSDMARALADIHAAFGKLDIVFANAGIAKPSPFRIADEENIGEQIDVNLKGVIYTVQKALPFLNNPASIIFTSTTLADQGIDNLSVYSATKAAIRSLARTLSSELKEAGVRVNVISPGLIDTPIYGKLGMSTEQVQAWAGELLKKVPAGRFGSGEEIAKAALFLASDESAYILGENLLVDGGMATV